MFGNLRKGDPCYNLAENLAELCSSVLWKVGLVNDKIGYLAEISKETIEGKAWFLLNTYSEMWKGRDELKKELLSKKEPDGTSLVSQWLRIHLPVQGTRV